MKGICESGLHQTPHGDLFWQAIFAVALIIPDKLIENLLVCHEILHLYHFQVFSCRSREHLSIIAEPRTMTGAIPAFLRGIPTNRAFNMGTG